MAEVSTAADLTAELRDVTLTIDGVRHDLAVESRESLWETMTYRLGLRGANLGCDRAQCGICNVILDGRSVNSCAVLTSRVRGRPIETVAGLRDGEGLAGLHPLQRAFWEDGAFQCGICTKGFLMSSLALLRRNPDPDDEEIRTALSGILCRCGEQERIVGAVRRAAAELREGNGSPAPDTLMPHTSEVLGTKVPRIQGMGSITEEGDYLSLISLPDMAFVRMLRSPYPRARILRIDASQAEALPGVVSVLHVFNLPDEYKQVSIEGPPARHLLNEELIQVGMPVAVVAAESEHIADDALALIEVEYEVLEPALDFLTAAAAAKQWDNPLPGTIRNAMDPVVVGDPETALTEAEVVVENVTTTPYEQHLPLELRTGLYYWEGETLVTYQTTHRTFDVRRELARWLGLEPGNVRVVQTGFMGSSYGSADHIVDELVLPAVVSKLIGRPVRSMLSREESFLTSAHRGKTRTRVKLGVTRQGDLTGLDVDVLYDGGTNAGLPASAAAAKGLTGIGVKGGWYVFQILYSYPHQRYEGTEVWTNNFRAGPMRGVGRVFGLMALETAIEKAAYAIGMDPLEFRLRNLNEQGAVFDEITGERPGLPFGRTGGHRASLERAAELIDWKQNWHPAGAREVSPGVFHGIAIVSAIDRGGGRQGGATPSAPPPPSSGQAVLHSDGSLEVFSGSTEVGAGQRTLMAMFAAQTTGITLDRVRIAPGVDTALNTDTGPSNSSLQTNTAGWGVVDACREVKQQLLERAAGRLGTSELEVRDGWVFSPTDESVRMSVADVVSGLQEPIRGECDTRRRLTAESVSTGAHAVEIEVDTHTGGIDILRYVAVHDVGRVLNRLMLEQQVEGGVVMGLGGALHEELLVDQATGLPINPNILDYKPPSLLEVPPMVVDFVEVPQDYGPYGAVAIGQASTPPAGPLLANALHNALGIWLGDLPLSCDRILAALEDTA
ncbi:MAG TPA: molybdopterin-dependent oxidoreductase [Solirubrobacteraceae bacterium]|jgi:CO/xanthine dehydrogenase Mo-binding subunit/aerobic-type carbon monoxide dehydrogenase small subunit (CoxS/CutS family)|nr:molybdopterin-dependent oxidoreductase [Solirubrobacteraceae bacterium]